MLIKCKECGLQVSDKAIMCPHCGFSLQPDAVSKGYVRKKNGRLKLPNGFGRITEIKNKNLRNRYRVMVTVGKDKNGKPIGKLLKPQAYFRTYNEAYEALVEYNKNPYDLDKKGITMQELYDKWSERYFKTLKSDSSKRAIRSAWCFCSILHKSKVIAVNTGILKECIDNAKRTDNDGNVFVASAGMKSRMKSVFNLMFDYALEHEIINRNPARAFEISKDVIKTIEEEKVDHITFTDDEMKTLWNHRYEGYVDMVLIQCYGGWRPQELGLIELKNVDLEKNIIIGGMKTDSGTDRIVPIHPKIKDLVVRRYTEAKELGSEYLLNTTDGAKKKDRLKLTYDKYKHRFEKIVKEYDMNPKHRAHDGRKQFITMCKKYNVDEYALKYIVGHKITDITERVYTDRDIEWLKEEISKVK